MQGISSVDVSLNTRLEYLPLHELVTLTSLTSLDCTGCPLLVSPPRRVADKGGTEVVSFLRRVADKGVFCCDSPLIITSCGSSSMSSRESWHDEGVDDSFRLLFDALTSIESKKTVQKGSGKSSWHARWGRKDAEEAQHDERVPDGVIRAAHWKPEGVRPPSLLSLSLSLSLSLQPPPPSFPTVSLFSSFSIGRFLYSLSSSLSVSFFLPSLAISLAISLPP